MMRVVMILFPFAWRNLWRKMRRTLITLAVVAVGVWSILTFNAVIRAWSDSALTGSLKNMTAEAQLHAPAYRDDPDIRHSFPVPTGRLAQLLDSDRIAAWAPRVRSPAIIQSEYQTLPVTLVGIDPQREAGVSFIADARIEGRGLKDEGDDGVLLGRHLAERLQTRVGKRIVIMANDADGKLQDRGARVVGIYAAEPSMEDAYLFTGLQPARQFLHADGLLSEIALMTPAQQELKPVPQQLRQAASQLDIAGWAELQPMTKGIHDFTQGFIYVWLWVMFVLIALGVVNTQLMAVFERTREFGLLQALGFRPGWVVLEVMLEAVQIIGFGVLLGAVSAYLTVHAMQGGISLGGLSAGADFLGIERILYPRLDGEEFIITIVVIWGMGWPPPCGRPAAPPGSTPSKPCALPTEDSTMTALLECRQLTKEYHQGDTTVHALRGVDLNFERGEFAAISGPSGSGKSTLLHIIGSLEQPTSGDVILDGVSLAGESREHLADTRLNRFGFVFQAYNLIPVLTAAEKVEFILQLQGVDAETRHTRSTELLHEVGLDDLGGRKPGQLSGGQQQRVAVARALASNPAIVLADEPTANLDAKNSDELLAMMSRLNQESNVSIIVSTHDSKVIGHTRRHIVLTDGRIDTDQTQAA